MGVGSQGPLGGRAQGGAFTVVIQPRKTSGKARRRRRRRPACLPLAERGGVPILNPRALPSPRGPGRAPVGEEKGAPLAFVTLLTPKCPAGRVGTSASTQVKACPRQPHDGPLSSCQALSGQRWVPKTLTGVTGICVSVPLQTQHWGPGRRSAPNPRCLPSQGSWSSGEIDSSTNQC